MENLFIRQILIKNKQKGVFPYTLPIIKNGSGKSTLLEAIAVAYGFNAEGGSKNVTFATAKIHSELCENITIVKCGKVPKSSYFLRAESFYNLASNIVELDENTGDLVKNYGGISLHNQSHGESFMSLITNRFRKNGLYLLDDPDGAPL